MNYFIEGLQGSCKSTLVGRLSEKLPGYKVYREGDLMAHFRHRQNLESLGYEGRSFQRNR